MSNSTRNLILMLALAVFGCGFALAAMSGAHAEPPAPFDRGLVERIVRAQETQARALEALARTAEKCNH